MKVISLSQLSLTGSSGIAEVKQPIWWADGTAPSVSNASSAGVDWIADGSASSSTSSSSSAVKLFTLSSNLPSNQKYAFESTLYLQTTSNTIYAELWDFTAGSAIASSQVSTTSTTATVVRSGQFTLTPSHQYGVTVWSTGAAAGYLIDASLIIFPS